MSVKRLVPVVAAVALSATALIAVPGTAADAAPVATAMHCDTGVIGVLPSGRLMERDVRNTVITGEKKSAPLPYKVDSMYGGVPSDTISGGFVQHFFVHASGRPAKLIDVTDKTASSILTVGVHLRYHLSPVGRTFTASGRFYTYGIAPNGNLTRWTRFTDNAGHYWFANPKVVRAGMGGVKTLSFMFWFKTDSGVRTDMLYATTKSGALKQFQIPWGAPGKPKVTTIKKTGFAQYTGTSLSWCNASGTIGSIVAVDSVHNQARWYTLAGQYKPSGVNLVRHPLVGRGANWRLHAVF